jgi:hypothetical protein
MSMYRTRRRLRQSVGDILVNAIDLERVSVAGTRDESDDVELENLASACPVTDYLQNVFAPEMARSRWSRVCDAGALYRLYETACASPVLPKLRVGPMRSPRIVLSPMLGSLVVGVDPARNARDSMAMQVWGGGSVGMASMVNVRAKAAGGVRTRRTLMSSTSSVVARLLVAGAWRLPAPDHFAIVSQSAPTYRNPKLICFGVSDHEARRIPGVYGMVDATEGER